MKPFFAAAFAALLCASCVTIPPTPREQFASSLRKQIARCWEPPTSTASTGYRPRFRIALKRDGALAGPPVLLNPSAEPGDAPLTASALAALKSCSPFKIPENLLAHPDWKELKITFDARPL